VQRRGGLLVLLLVTVTISLGLRKPALLQVLTIVIPFGLTVRLARRAPEVRKQTRAAVRPPRAACLFRVPVGADARGPVNDDLSPSPHPPQHAAALARIA
jgi:hypothetical protein